MSFDARNTLKSSSLKFKTISNQKSLSDNRKSGSLTRSMTLMSTRSNKEQAAAPL